MTDSDTESFHSACEEISDQEKDRSFLSASSSEEVDCSKTVGHLHVVKAAREVKDSCLCSSVISKAHAVPNSLTILTNAGNEKIGDVNEQKFSESLKDNSICLRSVMNIKGDVDKVDVETENIKISAGNRSTAQLQNETVGMRSCGDIVNDKDDTSDSLIKTKIDPGDGWETEDDFNLNQWETEEVLEQPGDGWDDWETTDVEVTEGKNQAVVLPEMKAVKGVVTGKEKKSSFWNWDDLSGVIASVSENISSAVETGLGLPSAEELAQKGKNLNEENPSDSFGVVCEDAAGITEINALGGFLSGIGSSFVTGSLDVLETLGKATFEKLTVQREGEKKRRLIFELQDDVNFSDVLKELREKQRYAEADQNFLSETVPTDATFIDLFESYGGFVHLEGLEMLSANVSVGRKLIDEVSSFRVAESSEDDRNDDFSSSLQRILNQIGLPYDGSNLIECDKRCFQKRLQHFVDARKTLNSALEVIAEFTAHCVQALHKLGQLTLIAISGVKEGPFVDFLQLVRKRLSFFGSAFVEGLNSFSADDKKIEDMITAVFLASEDGFTYVQQSLRLLGPLISQKQGYL